MEHSTHRVLRFNVGMRREIARSLVQALQRRPETPTHNCRTCVSNRNRYITVVHASTPKRCPSMRWAHPSMPLFIQMCMRPFDVRMGSRTIDEQAIVP
jgi:hypothetical protein